ncbi:MAG: hypothetical protein J7M19_08545 [Planctomycetes bacterium]|nr:hypothetical protein [Planctomycetota bacterium]
MSIFAALFLVGVAGLHFVAVYHTARGDWKRHPIWMWILFGAVLLCDGAIICALYAVSLVRGPM